MVLPNKKTIKNLNKAKAKALGVIGEQVSILGKLYDQLYQRAEELEDGYLKTQIKHELKKIEYFKAYLMMMEKKWLLAILSLKNEVLSKTEKVKGLSEEDKIQKNIWKLKNELNKFLDEEVGDEDVMHAQMATLDLEIQAQMEKLDATGGEGTADEEAGEVVIGHNTIFLKNSGLYTHATGVKYKINSEDKEFSIEEDVEVQIWINEDNQIKFNLLHKGELALKEELEIKNGDLYIKGETQSLKDYVEEHQNDAEVQAAEETVDVPAEVSEMVGKISDRALSVAERIKANEYRVFGENVEADDEAIKFHQVRIHREYSKGNPKTVVRFTLSESYWKKALAKINGDPSIPKSSVPFNFENGSGNSKSVNQQVRRFNVTAGKKKASVIIPADEHYRALTGEVRIILDPEDNFSKEEIQKLIEQAIVKLGVQKHFTEVTPASRARLQQRLKAMRKEDKNPAGSKDAVHDEYEAEQVDEEAIKDLRKAGLHSVYHQFGLDNLESVFKGGLLSTATRWAKGIFTEGLSSFKDLGTGGGSSAYARIHTKESASNSTWYNEKPAIVFAPEVFKRMDCYCYTSDTFGSTVPGTYDHRVSPKKLTNIMEKSYNSGNEVMFHDALDPKQAQYIVYNYPEKIIARLKKMGIKEIGGKSLEKAVITREEFRKINIIY